MTAVAAAVRVSTPSDRRARDTSRPRRTLTVLRAADLNWSAISGAVARSWPTPAADRVGAPLPDAVIRPASADDAAIIHALIARHASEGHLLERSLQEVAAHIDRFVVATVSDQVIGCADLVPLSGSVAEVRSLVVSRDARSNGIGRRLLATLVDRAPDGGFAHLAAFTHSPAYFLQSGFSIVPHAWVPEKIARDCRTCMHFRRCGQHAVMLPLSERPRQTASQGSVHA